MRLRPLDEVRAAGDLRWFESAVQRLRSLAAGDLPALRQFFSPDARLLIARAPGRLDVMGGIADYHGALVLELPLERSTFAILQEQEAPQADLATIRDGKPELFTMDLEPLVSGELRTPAALAGWFREATADRWAAYPMGLAHVCLGRAASVEGTLLRGFRLLIGSEVSEGKGVSSSAALEVASMAVLAAAYGVKMSPEALASTCQRVENHVVGAPCGIMDQMTSACGQRDRLLRLRCQPGTVEGHIPVPAGFRFYGIDSGIRHKVAGADYGTVRTASFMGYRIIAAEAGLAVQIRDGAAEVDDRIWGGYLANLSPEEFAARFERGSPEQMSGADFLERYGGTMDLVTRVDPARLYPVRSATAHPVREQARIERFATLLAALPRRPQAAWEMGELMYESHASYSACGLGSDGTDRLVELVREASPARGLFGAKITGGGSGGTVAIMGTDAAGALIRDIAARYREETGRSIEVFASSGPGAAETGILVMEHLSPA